MALPAGKEGATLWVHRGDERLAVSVADASSNITHVVFLTNRAEQSAARFIFDRHGKILRTSDITQSIRPPVKDGSTLVKNLRTKLEGPDEELALFSTGGRSRAATLRLNARVNYVDNIDQLPQVTERVPDFLPAAPEVYFEDTQKATILTVFHNKIEHIAEFAGDKNRKLVHYLLEHPLRLLRRANVIADTGLNTKTFGTVMGTIRDRLEAPYGEGALFTSFSGKNGGFIFNANVEQHDFPSLPLATGSWARPDYGDPTVPLVGSIPIEVFPQYTADGLILRKPIEGMPDISIDQRGRKTTLTVSHNGTDYIIHLRSDTSKGLAYAYGVNAFTDLTGEDLQTVVTLNAYGEEYKAGFFFRRLLEKKHGKGSLFKAGPFSSRYTTQRLEANVYFRGEVPLLDGYTITPLGRPQQVFEPSASRRSRRSRSVNQTENKPYEGETFLVGAQSALLHVTNRELASILRFFVDGEPKAGSLGRIRGFLGNPEEDGDAVLATLEGNHPELEALGIRFLWKAANGGWGLYGPDGQLVTVKSAPEAGAS